MKLKIPNQSYNETYRNDDCHQIPLRFFIIQGPINRNLSLMWQINTKIPIPISCSNPFSSYSAIRSNTFSISFNNKIFNLPIYTCICIRCTNILKNCCPNWCKLKKSKKSKLNHKHKLLTFTKIFESSVCANWL